MTKNAANECREKLKQALADTEKTDLIIPYFQVAAAFPAASWHPRAFGQPTIDDLALKEWCEKLGWRVDLASELVSESSQTLPPVRFRKLE